MGCEAEKTFRILKAEALAAGARDVRLRWGSKHPCIEATAPDGRPFKMHFAGSAGDRRSTANCMARLRRALIARQV